MRVGDGRVFWGRYNVGMGTNVDGLKMHRKCAIGSFGQLCSYHFSEWAGVCGREMRINA